VLRALPVLLLLVCLDAGAIEYFPLQQVRLLDGAFRDAQDRDIEYLLALDADRLLAPYLAEAGLEPRARNYGNWESSGLDGHIGGHYLSALSMAVAATDREDVRERLDYMLKEMRRAQDENGDGYLGGVPGGKALWAQVAAGDIRADSFGLNGAWVPWYNLHKVYAGLRDAWIYAGSEQARDMLVALADWADDLVTDLSDEQVQDMLSAEHGGMNEVFADAAAITGDDRYLSLARRFSHRQILDPLLLGEDRLTGLHANTQIPKVIGFERIAELEANDAWHKAALFFWETVVNERSVAIGGNSVREHFNDKHNFGPMMSEVEGPETCNTYNMLRLTRLLYHQDPDLEFVRYYERALYNHILSSQDPATGGLVYFTPMRPQHYRVYSQVDEAMWCCVGSGIENHVSYGKFIYAHDGNDLYVNLYIPSRISWDDKGVAVRQQNRFPDESRTRLVFENDASLRLQLRYPAWAASDRPVLSINDERQDISATPGSYIVLDRDWKAGDTVTLDLPMDVTAEGLPDGSDYYALLFGPIVLAAKASPFEAEVLDYFADDSRMGHIASGPICPPDEVPVFVADKPEFARHLQRVDGEELRFVFDGSTGDDFAGTELIPFFRLHRSRYMLYWPYSSPEGLELKQAQAVREEAIRAELDALTIDEIAPGEQQPEVEHDFAGEGSETGINFDRHWRHASGWFGYTLADTDNEARYLRVDYWGADRDRRFRIEVNSIVVAEVALAGEQGADFVSVDYPLDEAARAGAENGKHRLRFVAADGSIAGGIYGIRLLRGLPEQAIKAGGD